MKTFNFTSSLRNEMAHFVKLKQSSGSDYHSSTYLLFRFDQHLDSLSFHDTVLTLPIFEGYFEKISHLCSKGFSDHYSVLKQFSSWLNQYNSDSYVLQERVSIDRFYSNAAYIFTLDEIKKILETSGSSCTRQELVPGLYQTLFSLLYSTGIRIGEALSLNYGDYTKDEKLIHIRKGKFHKQRYLILSSSTATRLNEYVECYKSIFPLCDESPLFVNSWRRRLTYNCVCSAFDKTIKKSCIIKGTNGPKLHSFRHTFAVHRLLQWYKTEQDINAKLPFLSTYMGHVSIVSTQVYLEATNELMEAGCQRFHTFFLNHKEGDNL
jgi:integrase